MASGDVESPKAKKRKVECREDSIFESFFTKYEEYDEFILAFRHLLKSSVNAFVPSVILSCDASSTPTRYGRPFHNCECITDIDSEAYFHFGAFFIRGIEICNSLKRKEIPSDTTLKKAAARLLTYIMEKKDLHEELLKIEDTSYITGETQVIVTLAEHFFKQLSLAQGYIIDKHVRKDFICKCGNCNQSNLKYDDTSIGNVEVWHGNLDILFDSCNIAVKLSQQVEADDSPGGRSSVEVEDVENLQPRSQIIAQTIVFSFLQKQRHPYFEHFLTPCIIANNASFKIFVYDAENDVLLETRKFDFTGTNELNLQATIAAWLTLNYKVLCTGGYKEYVENAPKSNFKTLVKDSLSIYENNLTFRNVRQEMGARKVKLFNWGDLSRMDGIRWPESLGSKEIK